MPNATCLIPGCEHKQKCRGWCSTHYTRWRRHGDPLFTARPPGSPIVRLIRRIAVRDGGCWVWLGGKSDAGYGQIYADDKLVYTHRLSYSTFVGPIPEGLHIDHLCRNRACCNPWHLDPVPPAVNARRGMNPRKTHCSQGHLYDEANTYRNAGKRRCRACARERQRQKQAS